MYQLPIHSFMHQLPTHSFMYQLPIPSFRYQLHIHHSLILEPQLLSVNHLCAHAWHYKNLDL